ncbi:MAG: serine/threonine-protein kinase [Thermoanaerobaculia bacterium]
MNAEIWRRLSEILDQLEDLSGPERLERARALCQGDLELALAAERHLEAEGPAGRYFDAPLESRAAELLTALAAEGEDSRDAELAGSRVGPYRLLREIGRGGMGTVVLAERADGQFEQKVALKLISRGAGTGASRERFLAERQILARLSHSGIARLLDGGLAEDGRPYFAMEYVAGQPLNDYVEAQQLDLDARLALFLQICEAVQYAHRNLVVHRDLKPSNVLVTAEGEAKLLDFGIAKLLDTDSETPSGLTSHWGPLLTPDYAAPEQLLGQAATTSTDVYALGGLLYGLLCGEKPHRLRDLSLPELERAILEQEPERPSRVLARKAAGASRALASALHRRSREVSGDLDNIVAKALRKAPEERYSSVESLLADLSRYRSGLPVLASRATWLYRSKAFARRHRKGLAVASGAVMLAFAGLASTLWQARRAVAEAERKAQVKDFVLGLFAVSDPDQAQGEKLTARELLDRGAARIEHDLAGQPELASEMLAVVAGIFKKLGLYQRAGELYQRALALAGPQLPADDLRRAELAVELADTFHFAGDLDRAEPLYQQALGVQRRKLGEEAPATARTESFLARLYFDRGDTAQAEPLLQSAFEHQRRALGPRHADTVDTENALANLAYARGRYEESERLYREVLAARRELFGETHSQVSEALLNLATARNALGDLVEAEKLYRQVLELDRKLLGPQHPELAVDLTNLSTLLIQRGELAEAEQCAREALALRVAYQGESHPQLAVYLHNLGKVLRLEGKLAEAESSSRKALELARLALGPEHENVALVELALAQTVAASGRIGEAETLLRHALGILRQRVPAGDARTAEVLLNLGRLLRESRRATEAEGLLAEAHQSLLERFGEEDLRVAEAAVELGLTRAALGQMEEARRLLETARAQLVRKAGEGSPLAREASEALSRLDA